MCNKGYGQLCAYPPLVVTDEPRRRLGLAQPFEVHGEEGHIRGHVATAQASVELEAVEDPRSVIEAIDVIGLKIPMAVADLTCRDAGREQRLASREVAADRLHHGIMSARVEDRADEAGRRRHVRLELIADGPYRCDGRDLGRTVGPSVEVRHYPGHTTEFGAPDGLRLAGDQVRQGTLGGKATHHDGMIEGLTSHRDVGDSQVDIGGQPPVEIDLLTTVLGPCSRGREVGEVKSEGLAQFEDVLPQEQQDRDMGLTYRTAVHTGPAEPVTPGAP